MFPLKNLAHKELISYILYNSFCFPSNQQCSILFVMDHGDSFIVNMKGWQFLISHVLMTSVRATCPASTPGGPTNGQANQME